ncbi:MAG: helix-turn-helix transcriptional regulator [Pseudomonadota bacterium]
MPTLHERLKRAREDNELSVTEVCRIIGVKADSYKKWESGAVAPRANKLLMLAGVFNVAPAWLLDGDDEYLQALGRDQRIAQLRQRLDHMQAMQNRMLVMLDELTSDIDEVDNA